MRLDLGECRDLPATSGWSGFQKGADCTPQTGKSLEDSLGWTPLQTSWLDPPPGVCHSARATGGVRAGRAPPWVPGHGPRGHACELPVT